LGKTYKRPNNNSYSNENGAKKYISGEFGGNNNGGRTTILNFNYQEIIDTIGECKHNECDVNTSLKYLIAKSYQDGQTLRDLCAVLRNTLTGNVGETCFPRVTLAINNNNKKRRYQHPNPMQRNNTINHFKNKNDRYDRNERFDRNDRYDRNDRNSQFNQANQLNQTGQSNQEERDNQLEQNDNNVSNTQ